MTWLEQVAAALARLVSGYWNSGDMSPSNPGGLDNDGHVDGLPALLVDVGVVAQQVGVEAQQVAADKTAVAADKADVADMVAAAAGANTAAADTLAATLAAAETAMDTAVGAAASHAEAAGTSAGIAANAAASVGLPIVTGGDAGKSLEVAADGGYALVAPRAPAAVVLMQGKHSIWVPAPAMTARDTNGAAGGAVESATNKVMRKTLDFDAAVQEYAQFAVAMPKSWNEGTVSFQALWTAAGGSGGVAWALQAVARGDGDALDVAFGTAQTVTDALIAAGSLHQSGESGAVTIAGSPAENDLVVFQLYRAVTDVADSLAQDALLLGVRLFYVKNAGNDA